MLHQFGYGTQDCDRLVSRKGEVSPPDGRVSRGSDGSSCSSYWFFTMVLLERLRRTFWKSSSEEHRHIGIKITWTYDCQVT